MSLSTIVKRSVRLAFRQAGDLTETVVLSRRSAASFDFAAGKPDIAQGEIKTLTALVGKAIKSGNTDSEVVRTFLLNKEDVGSLEAYDTLTVKESGIDVSYSVLHSLLEDDGYTISVPLCKLKGA